MEPPYSSTISFEIDNPKPMPWIFVENRGNLDIRDQHGMEGLFHD